MFASEKYGGGLVWDELTCFPNMSPTVPPATLRKAEPARPSKNRATNIVPILRASAHGINQIRKKVKDHM